MFGKKTKTPWLTRNQLMILSDIRANGRAGIDLWGGDINLSTIRSLSKRGMIDTRSGGRVVVTRAGKRRLRQPWPAQQPVGDQKDRGGVSVSGKAEIAPVASGEASHGNSDSIPSL